MNRLALALLLFFALGAASQTTNITGTIQDTTGKLPLRNAVIMAVKLRDSTLLGFTRSDNQGKFKLSNLPLDTFQVLITHPKFNDQIYILLSDEKNNLFEFGNIIMPVKSQQLAEVIIYAYKDPIYYKGDTLIYTADSFKTRPNATVEDLLKKLPGIRVDAAGKITSQGKAVDKVLVDGDEFFGSDPTVATRNLNATSIESVQVYDKNNDQATTDNASEETIKVMNLKLKDEAKKGYFGKISAASDFQKFGEAEFLANKFNKKQKISVFALASNTPKSGFGWEDNYKYGLSNDMESFSDDDGNSYSYSTNRGNNGIPQTLKTGFYYADRIFKKTKINFNYAFSPSFLKTKTETRSQYFLTDTAYVTSNISETTQETQSHNTNLSFEIPLDSLTDLEIKSGFKYNQNTSASTELNEFLTTSNFLTRQTEIGNISKGNSYDFSASAKLNKDFKKKGRNVRLKYNFGNNETASDGNLKTINRFYSDTSFSINNVDQKKENDALVNSHTTSLTYVEPLTKKIKIELSAELFFNQNNKNKAAYNFVNQEYTSLDSSLTNFFRTKKVTERFGLKFIHETKLSKFTLGTRVRNLESNNLNVVTNENFYQHFTNILPFLSYRYKFKSGKSIQFSYTSGTETPSVSQLQPVPDNSNPNSIKLGNPTLSPTFSHSYDLNLNSFKPITGRSFYSSISFNHTTDDFGTSTYYDSIGRTLSKTVNIEGNYDGNFYLGYSLPILNRVLTLNPGANADIRNNGSYINGEKIITREWSANGDLSIGLELEKFNAAIGGQYTYNNPYSSISTQSNKPYSSYNANASFEWQLPKKFRLSSSANYTQNSQRTQGYNISYIIWNASFSKIFLKNENLVVSFEANDILGQNINANRSIDGNVITDTKTQVIKQYFLLRVLFKFNSSKTKESDDMF